MNDPLIRLDVNSPVFQRKLWTISKPEQTAVLGTLRKLSDMRWNQVYQDKGLKWELIHSKTGPNGERLYSFRIGQAFRAVAYRDSEWLRILSLHPDHDSTYR